MAGKEAAPDRERKFSEVQNLLFIRGELGLIDSLSETVKEGLIEQIAERLRRDDRVFLDFNRELPWISINILAPMAKSIGDKKKLSNLTVIGRTGENRTVTNFSMRLGWGSEFLKLGENSKSSIEISFDSLAKKHLKPKNITIITPSQSDLNSAKDIRKSGRKVKVVYIGIGEEFDDRGIKRNITRYSMFAGGTLSYLGGLNEKRRRLIPYVDHIPFRKHK